MLLWEASGQKWTSSETENIISAHYNIHPKNPRILWLNQSKSEDIDRYKQRISRVYLGYKSSTRMSLLMCCSPDLSGSNVYIPAADSGTIITCIIVFCSVYACRGVLYNVFVLNFGRINWSLVSVTSTCINSFAARTGGKYPYTLPPPHQSLLDAWFSLKYWENTPPPTPTIKGWDN